jgi:hypothetical protein
MVERPNQQGLEIFGRGGSQEHWVNGLAPQKRRQTAVHIETELRIAT